LIACFFFNHIILLLFFESLLLINILNFRSITLRSLFWNFPFNSSCFNFFYRFTFFKSPYFHLGFFFNSDSFSLDFSLLEFFFSFNRSKCFLLGSCSFISQFLDFVLFNHLFSFDSLNNWKFFFFNFFKFFWLSLVFQFLLSLKSFPLLFSFSFKSDTFLFKFPWNMILRSLESFFF
jgi:hypothetical protein